MDHLEKNWKHHAAVGGMAVALGLVTDRALKKKTVNTSNVVDIAMSFATVALASMGADYALSKKLDH